MTSPGRVAHSDGENDRAASSHRYRRAELRARLAAERAQLLSSLLGINVEVLESRPLQGTTSAAGMLSAVAGREQSFVAALTHPPDGSRTEIRPRTATTPPLTGFDEALARCIAARTEFLDAFARIPDAIVFAEPLESASALSPLAMATQCHWSDASLSLRASTWSRDYQTGGNIGPISLLRACVRAARKDLLTTVALVPDEARELGIFEGGRTLSQVFHLISALERTFLECLMRTPLAPPLTEVESTGADEAGWKSAWTDLHSTHAAVIRALDALDPAAYGATIGDGENRESVYTWARGCLLHDRMHGAQIRATLELDWPERLLR